MLQTSYKTIPQTAICIHFGFPQDAINWNCFVSQHKIIFLLWPVPQGRLKSLRKIIPVCNNQKNKRIQERNKTTKWKCLSSQTGNNWSPKSENETVPTSQTSEVTPEWMHTLVSPEWLLFFYGFTYCVLCLSIESSYIFVAVVTW